MRMLAAAPAIGSTFGMKEYIGLIFIGVMITIIWVVFLHLQGLTERDTRDEKPDVDPKPPAA